MTKFIMCEHHKKMIRETNTNLLMDMLQQQSNLIEQLTQLIDGMCNAKLVLKHLFIEFQGRPWMEVAQEFEGVRANAQAAFDIIHEELNDRLGIKLAQRKISLLRGDQPGVNSE